MVENLRKMQELRAQIQAQIKLAETLKKLSDNAGPAKIIINNSYKIFGYFQRKTTLILVSTFLMTWNN